MEFDFSKGKVLKQDASIFKRLFAFILDILIINIVIISPFQKVFLKLINPNSSILEMAQQLQGASSLYSSIFFIVLLSLAYFTFFEFKLLQTPGMMIFKMKVDQELSFGKAILRNLFIIPIFPFYILWVIDPIHLLFRKRRFLEEITNTRTIEEIYY
ncbi:MAG: RDD family protein [Nanoarchaeota archaeon]|nr:RDD family protein [Nanoarchaeota archaeon]MBU1269825.1 RDD family protein [Nanoarchaeota archaeon]MBU1604880.1 RDD family protein [Nanoarchaeota archaeon]MBU2443157.1 RDD family protein [Nanoarchaeota archaeon]